MLHCELLVGRCVSNVQCVSEVELLLCNNFLLIQPHIGDLVRIHVGVPSIERLSAREEQDNVRERKKKETKLII